MKTWGGYLAVLLFLLAGCGPEQSAQDREDDYYRKIIEEQKAYMSPFEGDYIGEVEGLSGKIEVTLNLYLSGISTGKGDTPRDMPSMSGHVRLENRPDVAFTYSNGHFDTASKTLRLDDVTPGIGDGGYLDLRRSGDNELTGYYLHARASGPVWFKKVTQ